MSVFMINSARGWLDAFADRYPPDRSRWLKRLYDRIGATVGNYVAGALLQATIAGVLAWIMLMILGVPYALPLAVVVFLLDLVPLVGATLGAIIVGVVTLFSDFPVDTIIWVIFSVIYQQVENTVIQPRIQARAVAVHPFVVLVSVLFGSTLFGVLGALLAIPVAAAIQISIREYSAFRDTPAEDMPPPGVPRRRPEPGLPDAPAPKVDPVRLVVAAAPAAARQQAGHRRDPAAEHEARHGGADHDLLLVLAQVLAPVGDLRRPRRAGARPRGRARRGWPRSSAGSPPACGGGHQLRLAGSEASTRPPAPIGLAGREVSMVCLISLPSSMAMAGVGGDAALDEAGRRGTRRGRRAAAAGRRRSGSRPRRS